MKNTSNSYNDLDLQNQIKEHPEILEEAQQKGINQIIATAVSTSSEQNIENRLKEVFKAIADTSDLSKQTKVYALSSLLNLHITEFSAEPASKELISFMHETIKRIQDDKSRTRQRLKNAQETAETETSK